MNRSSTLWMLSFAFLLAITGCSDAKDVKTASAKQEEPTDTALKGDEKTASAQTENGPVHRIVLPEYAADFPAGPGRRTFMVRCAVCHSLRYVTMQPPLDKKAWDKVVQKMVKTYGAHITDPEAREITEYLDRMGRP